MTAPHAEGMATIRMPATIIAAPMLMKTQAKPAPDSSSTAEPGSAGLYLTRTPAPGW